MKDEEKGEEVAIPAVKVADKVADTPIPMICKKAVGSFFLLILGPRHPISFKKVPCSTYKHRLRTLLIVQILHFFRFTWTWLPVGSIPQNQK